MTDEKAELAVASYRAMDDVLTVSIVSEPSDGVIRVLLNNVPVYELDPTEKVTTAEAYHIAPINEYMQKVLDLIPQIDNGEITLKVRSGMVLGFEVDINYDSYSSLPHVHPINYRLEKNILQQLQNRAYRQKYGFSRDYVMTWLWPSKGVVAPKATS